jgi:hypothetical protein
MRVYHLFAPGCSTLLARLKAAESHWQRPKDTLVQTDTVLLICSGILLAPARRRCRLGRHHGGCRRHGRRGAGDSVAATTTAKDVAADEDVDGDVVGGDTFAFESRAGAPECPSTRQVDLLRSRMRCGDLDVTTKIGYDIPVILYSKDQQLLEHMT